MGSYGIIYKQKGKLINICYKAITIIQPFSVGQTQVYFVAT